MKGMKATTAGSSKARKVWNVIRDIPAFIDVFPIEVKLGIPVLLFFLAYLWAAESLHSERIAQSERVHAETMAFAAELAAKASAGLEADALGAFANCYGALAAPRDNADVDRCEVQATQLATARGHDAGSANAVIQVVRTRLDVYAAELEAPHDAPTTARSPERG